MLVATKGAAHLLLHDKAVRPYSTAVHKRPFVGAVNRVFTMLPGKVISSLKKLGKAFAATEVPQWVALFYEGSCSAEHYRAIPARSFKMPLVNYGVPLSHA